MAADPLMKASPSVGDLGRESVGDLGRGGGMGVPSGLGENKGWLRRCCLNGS